MIKLKTIILFLMITMSTIFTTGCWNYREVDKVAIVAGVAIDKGTNENYLVTVEILHISGGKESKIESGTITMEGKTIFDAVRNGISLSGEKLYWSHAKVIILSRKIASEGVEKVIDWYVRDSETRTEVYVLVSQGDSAMEIFKGQTIMEEVKSFALGEMIRNQKNLSKAPEINILQFCNDLEAEGISAIAPAVSLRKIEGKILPQIGGTAIFKEDKLAGFLDGEETKTMLFIKDEIRGGVLVEGIQGGEISTPVTLEIFKNKTRVKPIIDAEGIRMELNVETRVAIDEIAGKENLIEDEGRNLLEQTAEKSLKSKILALIEKMQSQYDVDIFGFGAKLRGYDIKAWNDVSDNWDKVFKDLNVEVAAKVHIENSATYSKPIKAGD